MLQENQLFANRYRLVKRLGQGAFSEVWKAEDTKVGNLTVALKVYAPDKGLDEDGSKIFGEEFAIVFNIHHQNLLTPSTFDEEKNSPYLVLPFCERGSATRLIGKADERQVAQFLHDVSSALAYLHESEIVHQDIKPDNVLMDAKGNFLVTDFGISTRIRSTLRRSVGDKKSAGTMAYMGPERFGRNPKPIKASDVWSLGATIYELMSGDVPFGDMGGGMQMAGALVPDIPGNYSAPLKKLVELCLSKEPWDRPTAAQIRDICEGYLRTGTWDLSVLGKGETQAPEKPRKAAGRPTERKVFAPESDQTAKKPPIKETPIKPKPAANKALSPVRRKRLSWIIGGGVLAVTLYLIWTTNRTTLPDSAAGKYVVKGVPFTMIFVDGGTFEMGDNNGYYDEIPAHSVTVNDFCIGETEVTRALWKAVMGEKPMGFISRNRPKDYVSWEDAQEFVDRLNSITGRTFRLPTEAEWEYAARGGNQSRGYKYPGSDNDTKVYCMKESSVKTGIPNEIGLYGMYGGVLEWCQDWYGKYNGSTQTNPQGPSSGSYRVLRGRNTVSGRDNYNPYTPGSDFGFRIVLVP